MQTTNSSEVPQWVRCTICIVGCLSVPALVLAGCIGADVTPYLAAVVGVFAIRTATFAFRDRHIPDLNVTGPE